MRHNHPHGPVHSIHSHQHHIGWNNAFPPIAKAAPAMCWTFALPRSVLQPDHARLESGQ